jgi:hypothetical protein
MPVLIMPVRPEVSFAGDFAKPSARQQGGNNINQ